MDLIVEHNTVLHTGNVITAYGGTRDEPSTTPGFVFRHNLMPHNTNGVIGTGRAIGAETLAAFFPGGVFSRNVLAGGRASRYPAGNDFPEVQQFLAEFISVARHDYRLRRDSAFRRAAADGSDLGVNFAGLADALGPRARDWLGLPGGSNGSR